MALLVLLSDRAPEAALPALADLRFDVKVDALAASALDHVRELEPAVLLVDADENPGQAWSLLQAVQAADLQIPILAVIDPDGVERYPWHEVVDEFVFPGAPPAEIGLRVAVLRRRAGVSDEPTIRLGALSIDTETYRVTAQGRPLDLTFKEFELLRFLASRAGRVFTRPALLREVWGYDFYGGTRTVDVHVRRLRAKLGPEHEHLIQTVRSVGYRAAEAED
jgi:DNA-binding response OmpR family regulator